MVVFGVLGAAISSYLLLLCPPGFLAFDASGASAAFLKACAELVASKTHKKLEIPRSPDAAVSGLWVAAPLVVVAGFICELCGQWGSSAAVKVG